MSGSVRFCTMILTVLFMVPGIAPLLSQGPEGANLWAGPSDYLVLGRDDAMSIWGLEKGIGFGESISSGDIDGDGRDDIAVGVPASDLGNGGGAVLVYFSRDQDELFSLMGERDADLIVLGEDVDDNFGTCVLLKDMNGDGMAEIIVSAPYADGVGNARRDSGEVYVIKGEPRTLLGALRTVDELPMSAWIYGRDAGDKLGMALGAGDLDGDLVPELVIRSEGKGGKMETISEFENEAVGSWELEVIKGDPLDIGDMDLSSGGQLVRYWGSAIVTSDIYAQHIGEGLSLGDFDGDGTLDIAFSYRWQDGGRVCMFKGGPTYPGVTPGTTVVVHQGADFDPSLTIDLDTDGFGSCSLSLGDMDGDLREDLVVGMPYTLGMDPYRVNGGQVDVYRGGPLAGGTELLRGDAVLTVMGEDASDLLGSPVGAVDMDSDGFCELLIGAIGGDGLYNTLPNCGEGYIFDIDGVGSRYLGSFDAWRTYRGLSTGALAFSRITGGDFNGDGQVDLIISSTRAEPVEGGEMYGVVSILMEKKPLEAQFVGETIASQFGMTVHMDDFDGDGRLDMVVGDPKGGDPRVGKAYLFFGRTTLPTGRIMAGDDADIIYDQVSEDSDLGTVITSGDLNDDGRTDLVVSASKYYDGMNLDMGSVHIYWGGSQSYMSNRAKKEIRGTSVERAGSSVAIGDYNGDGKDDIALSTPFDVGTYGLDRYHAGVVFIFFGPLSTGMEYTTAGDVRIVGSLDNEFLGERLESADIDNDGYDDLVIGAPRSSLGSITSQGVVYVLEGRPTWPSLIDLRASPPVRIFGPWPFDQIGSSLEMGDIDSDGYEDLFIGTDFCDGFDRTVQEGGGAYLLKGSYLSVKMPSADISLRKEANMSIFGDQKAQRLGTDMALGDLDGNGIPELFIGSKGWTDPKSKLQTGGVFVMFDTLYSDRVTLNASSLPFISGFQEKDEAGTALSCRDINYDGRTDLLIGAPGSDPIGDSSYTGAAYLWMGKDVYLRNPKVTPIKVHGAFPSIGPLGREAPVLAPNEGPYTFTVTGRELTGVSQVMSLGFSMLGKGSEGSATFLYTPSTGTFSRTASGRFETQVLLDQTRCRAMNDGFQSWYVEFGITVGWASPEPEMIVTNIVSASGTHTNYLNEEFLVDKGISLLDSGYELLGADGGKLMGWLNSTSILSIRNLTVYHSMTGDPLGLNASKGLDIGLFRPDGLRIGTAVWVDGLFSINQTTPGEHLDGKGAPFFLGASLVPAGAKWNGNLTVPLNVDTFPPPEVSSFVVFPDGKEAGTSSSDDDRVAELYWENVKDVGSSGISRYELSITDGDGAVRERRDQALSGDMVMLGSGFNNITLTAIDGASNRGPSISRFVIVDMFPPRFSKPQPGDGAWLVEDALTLSILAEEDGTGLDTATAFYRLFRADVDLLSDWIKVFTLEQEDGGTRLSARVPGVDGIGNYIQWQIADKTGVFGLSQTYTYNVDMTKPTIEVDGEGTLYSPVGLLILDCFMEDTLSGLDLSTVSYKVGSKDDFDTIPWIKLGLSGTGASIAQTVEVFPGFTGTGYAQWQVNDIAGNTAESDRITLFMDGAFPVFKRFEPVEGAIQTEREVTVSAYMEDTGSGMDITCVEMSFSTLSGWVLYGVGGYSPWARTAGLEDLGGGLYKASSTVVLDEGPFNLVRFRAKDIAGNGWVLSTPVSIEVVLPRSNLPPVALFQLYPVGDMVYSGETIHLDATPSYDPEGVNLTYEWFSDLEDFPNIGKLGSGETLNVTLGTIGVHSIWLAVSDGSTRVESEKVRLRVERSAAPAGPGEEEEGLWDIILDALPYIIFALLLGLLMGALIVLLVIGRRPKKEFKKEDEQPLVEAVYKVDKDLPFCPHCGAEVRPFDEYCMRCGVVFSAEDREKIMTGKGKVHKKLKRSEERTLPPSDENGVPLPEPPQEGTPEEEGEEEMEFEELSEEEIEDLDEVEGFEDEDLDWGVGK